MTYEALRDGAADGPAGIARLLRPIDAGLEDLPHAPVTDDEIRAPGGGAGHGARDAAGGS